MEHRQHRCRPDPGAEEDNRSLSNFENEAAARGTDVESIANSYTIPQPRSSHTARLDLRADSIALGRERTRERVTAKNRGPSGGWLKPNDDVLARLSRRQRLTVQTLHRHR